MVINELQFSLTTSIGAALRSPQELPTATLSRADQALYHAKGNGRNRAELAN